MMTIWERVTGSDMTKEMNTFEARILKLPKEYQDAWKTIKDILFSYSDFTGRNLMPIFEGVVSLLEESNLEKQSIDDVFGNDIQGFCLALLGKEGAKSYRDKWRDKLNKNVRKKLDELEDK